MLFKIDPVFIIYPIKLIYVIFISQLDDLETQNMFGTDSKFLPKRDKVSTTENKYNYLSWPKTPNHAMTEI